MNDNEQKEFKERINEFYKTHPDCPEAKPIECLNLIMRKEFANQILNGEKKCEIRAFSKHYFDRLYDKDVLNYIQKNIQDDSVEEFAEPLREVKKIHFHNYNNSWFLDVECDLTTYIFAMKKDAEWVLNTYGDDEILKLSKDFDAKKEMNRPMFFLFGIGKILDTNIK